MFRFLSEVTWVIGKIWWCIYFKFLTARLSYLTEFSPQPYLCALKSIYYWVEVWQIVLRYYWHDIFFIEWYNLIDVNLSCLLLKYYKPKLCTLLTDALDVVMQSMWSMIILDQNYKKMLNVNHIAYIHLSKGISNIKQESTLTPLSFTVFHAFWSDEIFFQSVSSRNHLLNGKNI